MQLPNPKGCGRSSVSACGQLPLSTYPTAAAATAFFSCTTRSRSVVGEGVAAGGGDDVAAVTGRLATGGVAADDGDDDDVAAVSSRGSADGDERGDGVALGVRICRRLFRRSSYWCYAAVAAAAASAVPSAQPVSPLTFVLQVMPPDTQATCARRRRKAHTPLLQGHVMREK